MQRTARWIGFLSIIVLWTGCDYSNEQAIRQYDEDLQPVRSEIALLSKHQPRLQDKQSAARCVAFVQKEVLSRSSRINEKLNAIQPEHERLFELHNELREIWSDYQTAYDDFVDDLEEHNLRLKKRELQEILERQEVRVRWWNGEIRSLHETYL